MTRIGENLNSFQFSGGNSSLSNTQLGLDALQYSFSEQATNSVNLLAMTAGGLAYRLGKLGVCSVGAIHESPLLAKILAPSVGLILEVAAFRGVNHAFHSSQENYWSAQGFAREMINFGALKSVAHLMQGGNPIRMHVAQNLGMMLGEEAGSRLHLTPEVHGSFAERFVNASATNFALGAGHCLAKTISGFRLQVLERNLSQSIHSQRKVMNQEDERIYSMSTDRIYLEPADGKGGPLTDRFSRAVAKAIEVFLDVDATQGLTPEQLALMHLDEMGRTLLAVTGELQDRGANEVRLEEMLLIQGNPFLKNHESDSAVPELVQSLQGWSGFERLRDIAENSQVPNSMRCAAITALAFSNHQEVKEVLNRILNESEGVVAHSPLISQRKLTAKAALEAFERRQAAPFVRQESKPYRTI